MATCISKSPEATFALGVAWAQEARPGWVIGLDGDLGAGKTQLAKGLAHGLGISGLITSPTFTLLHEYHGGRLLLCHLDFYRLENDAQILSAGLGPYLAPDGVTLIEWIERWQGPRPTRYRHARLSEVSPTERRIEYEDFGD